MKTKFIDTRMAMFAILPSHIIPKHLELHIGRIPCVGEEVNTPMGIYVVDRVVHEHCDPEIEYYAATIFLEEVPMNNTEEKVSYYTGLCVLRNEDEPIFAVQVNDPIGNVIAIDPEVYKERGYRPAIDTLPDYGSK